MSHSYPVKIVKIWGGQKIHHFFHLKPHTLCQYPLWVHKQQHPWIPSKLGTKHSWYVFIHSCEYELILRPPKNITPSLLLSVIFQLKSVTFGSPITSMSVHGFQPNSNRVTPTMSSSYPVKMSKIWEIKKYHLLWCFHWQVTQKCNFWVTYNYHECPWIPAKLKPSHPHCVL